MRRISCSALVLFFTLPVFAAPVLIQVHNVKSISGSIIISVFSSAASWNSEVPDMELRIAPVTAGVSSIQVDLPPGEYGFFLFDDVNGDGTLKKTWVGFPAEPYAFSNNLKIDFKKPTFEQMKFAVPVEGIIHSVTLNHP